MHTKLKIFIVIAVVVVAPIVWYFISPIFRVVERQEASPLEDAAPRSATVPTPSRVKDAMDTMDAATKAAFDAAVAQMKDKATVKQEAMPQEPRLLAQAQFIPRAHDVAGRVLLIEKDGKRILRFEDFETINGPDLRIFLSSELGVDDAISLGEIRATRGNVNYELPEGADTKKYNRVLVWCYAFSVLFSYAELK